MADTYEIEIMPKWTQAGIASLAAMAGKAVGAAVGSSGAGSVGGAVGAVAGVATSVASPVTGALAGVGAMLAPLSKFIEAFGPAAALMDQFQMALSDVFAVVGQALTPMFKILIPYVQMLGDFLASIMPDLNSVFDALLPALDTMKGYLTSLAPLIGEGLQMGVQALAMGISALVKVFDWAVKAIAQMMIYGLSLIPATEGAAITKFQRRLEQFVAGDSGGFEKTARGLSGQGAQKVGLQELQSQMFSAALGKSDPMVDEQKKTNGWLQWIAQEMGKKAMVAAEWGGGMTGNDGPVQGGGGDF